MKNLKKAELTVIVLTFLCLCFTAGYFVGRGTAVQVISFDQLSSAPATDLSPPIPSLDVDTGSTAASQAVPDTKNYTSDVSMIPGSDTPAVAGMTDPDDSDKININTASSAKLDELPGIGPVLAQSIIKYRENIGGFISIEQIKDVDGIGEKKFAAMKDMITIG